MNPFQENSPEMTPEQLSEYIRTYYRDFASILGDKQTRYNRNAGRWKRRFRSYSSNFISSSSIARSIFFGGFVYRIKDGLHLTLEIARKSRDDLRARVPGIKEYSKSKRIS
jgi:hypothetical protein